MTYVQGDPWPLWISRILDRYLHFFIIEKIIYTFKYVHSKKLFDKVCNHTTFNRGSITLRRSMIIDRRQPTLVANEKGVLTLNAIANMKEVKFRSLDISTKKC